MPLLGLMRLGLTRQESRAVPALSEKLERLAAQPAKFLHLRATSVQSAQRVMFECCLRIEGIPFDSNVVPLCVLHVLPASADDAPQICCKCAHCLCCAFRHLCDPTFVMSCFQSHQS